MIMVQIACILFTLVSTVVSLPFEWKEYSSSVSARYFNFTTNTGWALNSQNDIELFTTNDYGISWKKETIVLDLPKNDEWNQWRNRVSFYGTTSRWVLNKDTLHHSTDGGANWNSIILKTKGLKSIYFLNETHGVANDEFFMYWTDNCGKEWYRAEMDSTNEVGILYTHFIDTLNGWIACWSITHWDAGAVLHTTDGGRTWSTDIISNLYNAVYCTDNLHCFAVGLNPLMRCGVLTMTSDGWKTNKDIYFEPFLDDVVFLNSQTGLIIGDSLVWETTDSGNTWTKIEDLYAYGISRSNNALYISSKGKMLKYELPASKQQNKFLNHSSGSRFVFPDYRHVFMNSNQTPILRYKIEFDLLGKSATRITGYSPGCYLVKKSTLSELNKN